jgi:hypothetical protein
VKTSISLIVASGLLVGSAAIGYAQQRGLFSGVHVRIVNSVSVSRRVLVTSQHD